MKTKERLPYPTGANKLILECDNERFTKARESVLNDNTARSGIGSLGEKSLHKMVKIYTEEDTSRHEIKCYGHVADIKNDEGVFEIQTRAFEKLNGRLEKMLPQERVTVICTLSYIKTVRWLDCENGEISEAHKSPKRETVYDAFFNLFQIRNYLNHKNLRVRILFFESEEYRALDGWDRTRKRGSTRIERIPKKLVSALEINNPVEYAYFIPESLGESFVASEFCRAIGKTPRFTYYVLKMLCAVGAITENGKKGKAIVYKKVNFDEI